MTTTLRNIGGSDVDLYAAAGEANSFTVPAGETVEINGDVMNADDEGVDYWQVGEGDNARHWPRSMWELVGAPKPKAAPKPAGDKEGR